MSILKPEICLFPKLASKERDPESITKFANNDRVNELEKQGI